MGLSLHGVVLNGMLVTVLFPWVSPGSRQRGELLISRHEGLSFPIQFPLYAITLPFSWEEENSCSLPWRLAVACSCEIAPYLPSFTTSLNDAGTCSVGAARWWWRCKIPWLLVLKSWQLPLIPGVRREMGNTNSCPHLCVWMVEGQERGLTGDFQPIRY